MGGGVPRTHREGGGRRFNNTEDGLGPPRPLPTLTPHPEPLALWPVGGHGGGANSSPNLQA